MPDCKIEFSLVSESLVGDIGDDWKYNVTAEVYNPGLTGAGTIGVPEHQLRPNTTQLVPGPRRVVVIPAGPCASGPRVKLKVDATEVDIVFDDTDTNSVMVPMECPGVGGPPFEVFAVIPVTIRESPRLLGGAATISITVHLISRC